MFSSDAFESRHAWLLLSHTVWSSLWYSCLARSMVLEKWYADPTRYLSADECASAQPLPMSYLGCAPCPLAPLRFSACLR